LLATERVGAAVVVVLFVELLDPTTAWPSRFRPHLESATRHVTHGRALRDAQVIGERIHLAGSAFEATTARKLVQRIEAAESFPYRRTFHHADGARHWSAVEARLAQTTRVFGPGVALLSDADLGAIEFGLFRTQVELDNGATSGPQAFRDDCMRLGA
jgi:hypothetical protein